jgi:hypothetical protein
MLRRINPEDMDMEAPEPDDLGVEKLYLFDSHTTVCEAITPGRLMVTDSDSPSVIIGQDGRYYVTYPFPEGGFVYF